VHASDKVLHNLARVHAAESRSIELGNKLLKSANSLYLIRLIGHGNSNLVMNGCSNSDKDEYSYPTPHHSRNPLSLCSFTSEDKRKNIHSVNIPQYPHQTTLIQPYFSTKSLLLTVVKSSIMSSSSAPKPASELVVLGSLSKAPNFFPKEGDEEDGATFWSPVDIYHDAIGLVSSTAVGIAQAAVMDTQNTFPGLAQFRSETTAISQVVGRASDISDNFPPIWYINFSPDMGDWQRRELNERVQAMKDFKCWSSLKWWADVFKEIPTTRDHANKMRQSTAFVFLAMRDLYSLDW
jgi:hypothetical protein